MKDRRTLMAFTRAEAARLAGLSLERVRRWAGDLYVPQWPNHALYSFRDIVALRTLEQLREKGVSRQRLLKANKELRTRYDQPWSRLRFYVSGSVLYFEEPGTGHVMRAIPLGQVAIREAIDIRVADVERETEQKVKDLRTRPLSSVGKVERRTGVQAGQMCIKGTRITTSSIADFVKSGISRERILLQYPELEQADIERALQHELGPRHAAG